MNCSHHPENSRSRSLSVAPHRSAGLRSVVGVLAFLLLPFSSATSSATATSGRAATEEYEAYVGPTVDVNSPAMLFLHRVLAERGRPAVAGAVTGQPPGTDVQLGGWNETTIAVNPINSLNIAYASLYELRVSTDGGTTWQEPVPLDVPNTHIQSGDQSLAFDRDGRLFCSYLGQPFYDTWPPPGGTDLFVAQCDPVTGQILPGYPINVTEGIGLPGSAGDLNDKEWLAADSHATSPFANRLYLAWTFFPVTGGTAVLTSHSSDHGISWSPAVVLQPAGGGAYNLPVHITVAPNGDVYAAYHRQTGFFAGGVPNGVSGYINVFRSTNGGVTYPQLSQAFTPGQADMTFNRQNLIGTIPGAEFWTVGSVQPWVLADPTVAGRIYVVASDDPDNNVQAGDAANVYIARSTDDGLTWSAPLRVDRGPGTTFQVMPTASIDPVSGAIVVHYYDNRSGAVNPGGHYLLDVFATVSVDGGSSFYPDFQVNDLPFDPDRGGTCRFDCGPGIFDVWADAGGQAYAVTDVGHLLGYDGSSWQIRATTSLPKFGVWGSSISNVFLCGAGGQIHHWDGNQLTLQNSNTTNLLWSVDGRSGSDVYAAGANGTVVHYNGAGWSLIGPGTGEDFFDVWVNPTGDVWVVGEHGTVCRYNGNSWTTEYIGEGAPRPLLAGIWGSGDGDVWVTSVNGDLHHWHDSTWTIVNSGLGYLTRVWGSSATDVIAVGAGRIRHFNGSVWLSEDVSEHGLLNLHGSGPSNVFAVGFNGFIGHYDGAIWLAPDHLLTPTSPTRRIGEYNGVASGGGRSFAVWCGNTLREEPPGGPLDQQAIFDSFETAWQTGISIVDLSTRAPSVVLEHFRPNPASGTATVAYTLPRSETVDLALVNVQGRRVATLIHGRQPAGRHVVSWNGENATGAGLPAGVYFLRLKAGQEMRTERVTLMP